MLTYNSRLASDLECSGWVDGTTSETDNGKRESLFHKSG